ncbi:MAG: class F sortase [Stackebrandtia sp.]
MVATIMTAAAGCGLILGGLTSFPTPPPQPESDATPAAPPTAVPSLEPGDPTPEHLSRSEPVQVTIDAVDVDAPVVSVGVSPDDGSIQTPELDEPHKAGWFSPGPSPGEIGAAALVGHVDSDRAGAAVFYAIGALNKGDSVDVVRADGSIATFKVDIVESYRKKDFPYGAVFAGTGYAGLRLITCGGGFDDMRRSYTHNTVVYATLDSIVKTPEET